MNRQLIVRMPCWPFKAQKTDDVRVVTKLLRFKREMEGFPKVVKADELDAWPRSTSIQRISKTTESREEFGPSTCLCLVGVQNEGKLRFGGN